MKPASVRATNSQWFSGGNCHVKSGLPLMLLHQLTNACASKKEIDVTGCSALPSGNVSEFGQIPGPVDLPSRVTKRPRTLLSTFQNSSFWYPCCWTNLR